MKVNNENSLNRSRKQNSVLPLHISGVKCSLSIKGVLHYAGHGQKPQTEEYLTLSGFALSHSQEVHRHFVLQFIPPSEEYLPLRISITAHTHLHTCMSDFSSAFTLVCLNTSWAGKITSPSTDTTVTCTFSQSHSSDTQINPGNPSHTYRERLPSFLLHGPVVSQQWPDKTWQLQERLKSLRFYRFGRQAKRQQILQNTNHPNMGI